MAGRARLSLSHTVLLSLSLLSERISFRLEKGNVHRIFSSFCERANTLEESLIRWPLGGWCSKDVCEDVGAKERKIICSFLLFFR